MNLPLEWSNTFVGYDLIAETEHYAVIHNSSADKFTDASDYFLILKSRNSIESRAGAFIHIMVHMHDAESAHDAVINMCKKPNNDIQDVGNARSH